MHNNIYKYVYDLYMLRYKNLFLFLMQTNFRALF